MDLVKVRRGVLRVTTSAGTRYVAPSLAQRLRLLWIFRNFTELPEKVMSQSQQHLIAGLCSGAHFIDPTEVDTQFVIGTVERSLGPVLVPRKAAASEVSPLLPARRHG